ncbi:MAG TPA: site-2 protease family protein [Alphaproteobacteria bacterium]|nr:site-2 protease family protein [Alphaproteobacteria bacterium]
MTFLEALLEKKFIILFYLVAGILIYIYRKKFDVESGIAFLYRTNFGIKFMDRLANKNKEFWKIIGYIAIGVGFLGMALIFGYFIKGIYDLFFIANAPPAVGLVIPGVNIPGSPSIPFGYGMLALFLVILVHEFGHGVIAKAHGLKIKNTGFGFFGPLPLAFVEPDEKQVVKKDAVTQYSIFAAGPFFNALLAIFAIILIAIASPLAATISHSDGVYFNKIEKNSPAREYGIEKKVVYTEIDGVKFNSALEFAGILQNHTVNDTVVLTDKNGKDTSVVLGQNEKTGSTYLGVSGINEKRIPNSDNIFYKSGFYILYFLTNLFQWVFTLSLGIGLANLLPLGPVDGGRMFHRAAVDIRGKEKGIKLWGTVTIITLVILLTLLFGSIIKATLF